jgi:CxxC motif-containing protein (DUF1111 family)
MKAHRKLFAVSLLLPSGLIFASCTAPGGSEDPADDLVLSTVGQEEGGPSINAITEAPTGFDNLTNGHTDQVTFDANLDVFAEQEFIADGLGPVYNAQSCGECHQNPVTGAASQIGELRAGHFNGVAFVNHPGGSLMNDRAIDSAIQERVLGGNEVRTFRITISLMGDGFVECIDSNRLQAISNAQPAAQRGSFIQVPVDEAGGALRGARFGHKNQHASLISFAADAYLNEMGITSPLQPVENTSNGGSVAAFDDVADPEDDGDDIEIFAEFMRALKAPSRDLAVAGTASAIRGSGLFNSVGCAVCHVRDINTVPPGTVVNQGQFTCDAALGDKTIHPFGDFLLHNVGTGDGIVQNGGAGSRNQIRTAPLWGLRSRNRLMHDGESLTRSEAILRHAGQAQTARNNFAALGAGSRNDLITFLNSL